MEKNMLKKRRMWTYFIDATEELIQTEGFRYVTIRKVAEKAGYNSATIYNYFDELSHLLFFASLKFLRPYIQTVTDEMDKTENPVEKYLIAWKCFSEYSFKIPEIFNAVFLMDLGDHPENMLKRYYELYPSDLVEVPEELLPGLLERSLTERGRFAINFIVQEGLLDEDAAEELNELTNLVWQGMFSNFLNKRNHYTAEKAQQQTMKYIQEIVEQKINRN
ncbi:TetR/AcrR family transcriptional regulator [Planococcus sp. CPCC 101016]|uniref:TetR/AcrR family transcriptional regulator n=1 Tax=Planococcus sp. CPCC 101016 TaxID=2599617 RepID=UPI0021BD086B|nr:TetR/AcrR family transcriptional regulator [Planococcus sp. CPCC 101016]